MARKQKTNAAREGKKLRTRSKLGLTAWLRGRFFAGIVIFAPLFITFSFLGWLIEEFDKRIKPLIPPAWNPDNYLGFALPGLGLIVAIVVLTLLGAVATNLIGRSLIAAGDRLLGRVPVVRNIYSALKQLFETIMANNQSTFKEVVMIEYPKRGTWCLGFLTAPARHEIDYRLGHGKIGVFVPTTPNPTSGFLMYVDPKEVIRLDMSVEEGAKMIVSAGLVVPPHAGAPIAPQAISGALASAQSRGDGEALPEPNTPEPKPGRAKSSAAAD